jgi:oligosaccharide repeat unit polymerase
MLEFAFWFLYLATPVIMVFSLRLAGEQVNRISLVNVVVLSIYSFSIIGTLPLFYQWDEYRADIGVIDQTLIFEILFYSSVNLISLLVGVIFARGTFNLKQGKSPRLIQQLGNKQMLGLFMLLILSVATTLFYISQLDSLAILVALSAGVKDAGVSRSLMGNDFSGKYHWYHLFMHDTSQFIAYVLFANYLVYKTKRGLIYFSCAFLFSSFVAILATEKGPLSWFLIGLFFVYILVNKNGTISIKSALKFLLILVGALMLMYVYFMGSTDLWNSFLSVLSRSFTGQITPAYFYLQYFPGIQDYLWGTTFPNPGGLLPFTPFRYTVEIMNMVFPNLAATGVVGSMPTVFWGESYLNFGPLGIPIIAIFVGIILTAISKFINSLKWNSTSIGFGVWAILHYKDLSGTGFSGFFIDISVFIIFLFCLLINAVGSDVK